MSRLSEIPNSQRKILENTSHAATYLLDSCFTGNQSNNFEEKLVIILKEFFPDCYISNTPNIFQIMSLPQLKSTTDRNEAIKSREDLMSTKSYKEIMLRATRNLSTFPECEHFKIPDYIEATLESIVKELRTEFKVNSVILENGLYNSLLRPFSSETFTVLDFTANIVSITNFDNFLNNFEIFVKTVNRLEKFKTLDDTEASDFIQVMQIQFLYTLYKGLTNYSHFTDFNEILAKSFNDFYISGITNTKFDSSFMADMSSIAIAMIKQFLKIAFKNNVLILAKDHIENELETYLKA